MPSPHIPAPNSKYCSQLSGNAPPTPHLFPSSPSPSQVVYVGDSRSREAIRAFEFDVDRRTPRSRAASAATAAGSGGDGAAPPPVGCSPRRTRFEVVITTYELILKDAPILGRIE